MPVASTSSGKKERQIRLIHISLSVLFLDRDAGQYARVSDSVKSERRVALWRSSTVRRSGRTETASRATSTTSGTATRPESRRKRRSASSKAGGGHGSHR